MTTWILLRNIPPELYGIKKDKWEKEQQRTLWIQRELKKEVVKDALKRGARILEDLGDRVLIEEPSIKQDTAGKIFQDLLIKDKVDEELLLEFQRVFGVEKADISHPTLSYYSPAYESKITAHFIVMKEGKKEIKTETRIIKVGLQQIVFLVSLKNELDGILNISYERDSSGIFRLSNIILTRKVEEEKIDKEKLLEKNKLPKEFTFDEEKIYQKIFGD